MNRYHPVLVALHWLLAIMILISLLVGGPMLAEIKNSDPQKVSALTGHLIWGICIGGLMLARLAFRMFSSKPPQADAGHRLSNLSAQFTHAALYVLVFAMVFTGLGIAYSGNIFAVVSGGSEAVLPANFDQIPARTAHGIVATLLLLLIALHVIGWAYHQFVRRDRLISRMWFGRRA